jgi:hypothetical protein
VAQVGFRLFVQIRRIQDWSIRSQCVFSRAQNPHTFRTIIMIVYFCTVDFDSSKISHPQGLVASMFKDVATEIEIQYDSVSVTKEDMINEYTASLPTTATVRLEIDGLDMNIDAKQPLETLLDRRMNEKTGDTVHSVDLTRH